MANAVIEQLDAKVEEILSGWNISTTVLTIALLLVFAYPLFTWLEPDTHPLLLARQASASPVRQPGESAVYRSLESPHGYPLKTGLNVKEPGAPKWSSGKDGDLRDIWRQVVRGVDSGEGLSKGHRGRILTVFGKEEVVDHDIEELSCQINIIGNHIQQQQATRVAIYLPNSIELLLAIFAAAFYGFSPILIPFNQPHDIVIDLLKKTSAEALVAQAGTLPLGQISQNYSGLKHVIWVVEKSSEQMDWKQMPDRAGENMNVSAWHDLIEEHKSSTNSEAPSSGEGSPPGVVTVWQARQGTTGDIVQFSQANLVAAVAALVSSLPPRQRLTHSDLFLPADSLTNTYVLSHTLAALHFNASIALTSVASPGVDLSLAARTIAPTVIVVSAETAAKLHAATKSTVTTSLKKFAHYMQTQSLISGAMPAESWLTRLNPATRAAIGAPPGKLRLLFVSERLGADTPPLTSADLSDLRIFTGARVLYALTAAPVAGAVTQTHVYDYRRAKGRGGRHAHFGVPLSSVEVKLVDTQSHKTRDDGNPEGEIVVSGPAVANGTASLGVAGTFREDNTLAYA